MKGREVKGGFEALSVSLIFCIFLVLIFLNSGDAAMVDGSNVSRSFVSSQVGAGDFFTVTLEVSIKDTSTITGHDYYLIDEIIPVGFTVTNAGGGNASEPGHIKFIKARGAIAQNSWSYSYTAQAPSQAGTYFFNGFYFIQNMTTNQTIEGQTEITVSQAVQSCTFTDAYWTPVSGTDLNVIEGELVNLNVVGTNCADGERVNLTIMEDDWIFGDDNVNMAPPIGVFSGGRVTVTWIAEYSQDSFPSLTPEPEYYFNAELVSDSNVKRSSGQTGAYMVVVYPLCIDDDDDGYNTTHTAPQCGVADCNDGDQAVHPGVAEICDGINNNCAGGVDELLTQPTTCGVGICASNTGLETCTAGVWGGNTCNPFGGAQTEICDGLLDDDCDNYVDNGCSCTNGRTRSCGFSNIGECKLGLETCTGGVWPGVCVGNINPLNEICDNKDNDCDGNIDESGVCSTSDSDNDTINDDLDCNDNSTLIGECTGCAVCSLGGALGYGEGTCISNITSCQIVKCGYPLPVCGKGGCTINQLAVFPKSAPGVCSVLGNIGSCTVSCIPVCQDNSKCNISIYDQDGDGIPDVQDYCDNTGVGLTINDVNIYGFPNPIMNKFKQYAFTSNLTHEDFGNITDFTIGINNIAKIDFGANTMKLFINNTGICKPLDFDSYVNITLGNVEIKSENLSELNKSAVITMYNITLTSPYIIMDGKKCANCVIISHANNVLVFSVPHFSSFGVAGKNSITGNVVYGVGGCGDGNCSSAEGESCSSCPGDCGACPPGSSTSSGGSSGSSGGTPILGTSKTFELNKNHLSVKLSQGQKKTDSFSITNTGSVALDFDINSDLSLVSFVQNSLKLAKSTSGIVNVDITAGALDIPNIYVGKIFIDNNVGTKKEILVSVEVISVATIFDVVLKLSDKSMVINSGGKLDAKIDLTKLSDVTINSTVLNYIVKDESGEEIVSESETISIDSNFLSVTKEILLPENLNDGEYLLYVQLDYDGKIASASNWFTIESKAEINYKLLIMVVGILFLIVVVIVTVIFVKRRTGYSLEIYDPI